MQTDKEVTEVRSFQLLASYYKRFIEDFSIIVTSLMGLTKMGKKFMWNARFGNNFIILKK